MISHRRPVLVALGLLMALGVLAVDSRPTQAHGYILRSIPGDRTVLDRSPSRIQVWFSEGLEPKFSTITLANEKGETIPLADAGVVPTSTGLIAAKIPQVLSDGAYLISLRIAFSSDGHVDTQTLVFWVGKQTGTIAAQVATQSANPWEVGWRILTFIGLVVLFGALLLYSAVLLPGWGTAIHIQGRLAPRVMRRLSLIICAALALADGGSIYALLQQSTALFATDLASVLKNGLWSVVLHGTEFGDVLTLRLLAIIVVGALHVGSIVYRTRQPAWVMPLWTVNLILAGVALGSLSLGSHAAGATLWTPLALGIDYVHLVMNAAWIGGLVALTLVIPPAVAPLAPNARQEALRVVLRRFALLGGIAVLIVGVTGLFSALEFVRQPSDLPDTNYGRTLLLKIALIAPLLLIALYHHGAVANDRLARWVLRINFTARIEQFVSSLRLESIVGIGVLVTAAALTASPPPIPPDARANAAPPTQSAEIRGLRASLSIDPGAAGSNSYLAALNQGNQPVSTATIELRLIDPAIDRRSDLLTLDNAGDGSYNGAGAELERSGQWVASVDVRLPDATDWTRFAFRWTVPDTPPSAASRQPTFANFLALFGILLAFGVMVAPSARRSLRAMTVHPESFVAALAVTGITAVLIVMGWVLMNQAGQQTDALRNPPPSIVNPILPDEESIAAGRAVYSEKCAACHGPADEGGAP
ncbi:MAG TPA: CopD family protein, partial [Aggregatilineaceae bacterium]|nr:CopD family protein [Aggregatilineaceae bacterium]